MKTLSRRLLFSCLTPFILLGCATAPPQPPLTYLALEKPQGTINTPEQQDLNMEFSRGGFYFLNFNFRPAADIRNYLEEAEKNAKTGVLKNADIQFNTPFAFDLLLFGYNKGTDVFTSKK